MNLRFLVAGAIALSFSTSFAKVSTCTISSMEDSLQNYMTEKIRATLGDLVEIRPETLKFEEIIMDASSTNKEVAGKPMVTKFDFHGSPEDMNFAFSLLEGMSEKLTIESLASLANEYLFKHYDVSFQTKQGNTIVIENMAFLKPTVMYTTDMEGLINGKYCFSGLISHNTVNLYGNPLSTSQAMFRPWYVGVKSYGFKNKETGAYLRTLDRRNSLALHGDLVVEEMTAFGMN